MKSVSCNFAHKKLKNKQTAKEHGTWLLIVPPWASDSTFFFGLSFLICKIRIIIEDVKGLAQSLALGKYSLGGSYY